MKFTNPQSIDFKLRLHSLHPDVEATRSGFFDALNNDPSVNMKIASMMNEVVEDEFASPAASEAQATELQNVVTASHGPEDKEDKAIAP